LIIGGINGMSTIIDGRTYYTIGEVAKEMLIKPLNCDNIMITDREVEDVATKWVC
jgi:hypothetical protein